ncbi:hypothetical protein F5890DRAFT_1565578 [Lentinula detonsa]|uniref:Uncharacterized protein n=1 Tax=Lentinula detonsa TaxID=2804962 RepID=A0AA38US03_9AGAR|nr:hypothetical protein F5890DRAFT_1565578 [Lentinula detonsa]
MIHFSHLYRKPWSPPVFRTSINPVADDAPFGVHGESSGEENAVDRFDGKPTSFDADAKDDKDGWHPFLCVYGEGTVVMDVNYDGPSENDNVGRHTDRFSNINFFSPLNTPKPSRYSLVFGRTLPAPNPGVEPMSGVGDNEG